MGVRSFYKNVIFTNPLALVAYLLKKPDLMRRELVLRSAEYLFGHKFDYDLWNTALREVESEDVIPTNPLGEKTPRGNEIHSAFGKWIYCAVRALRPESVVETGVAHGRSSWIILNALRKNGFGTLYSIDSPNDGLPDDFYVVNDETKPTGWVVPDILRDRWRLIRGRSRDVLPDLLREISGVDIFFHDSDHTYDTMMFEFKTAWPAIKPGGLLIADDSFRNRAFDDFIDETGARAVMFRQKGATAIKE